MHSAHALYRGQRVALLTQHGKQRVIAPVLARALGCHVALVTGYDTDLLGSFTRDIPRAGTQLDAARQKARIGMEISGIPRGLASEGCFGPDPFAGMLPWNLELLIFIDDERGLEIVGRAQGKASFAHQLAADWAAGEAFAKRMGFPEQHLVLRPDSEDDSRIRKGINSWAELKVCFAWALNQSSNGQVFLETDVRADANPTRMENIRLAAEDLAQKLCCLCPACSTPGFSMVERVAGLACADCGAPTRETRAEVHGCLKCAHRLSHELTDRPYASPSACDYCNP
jgi:hypothetical protein